MSALWVLPDELGDQADSEFAAEAAKAASELLWAMSGRKYSGVSVTTERYVRGSLDSYIGLSADNAVATTTSGTIHTTRSGYGAGSRIKLRGTPVTEILAVRTYDGAIVSPDSYYLVDHSTLEFPIGTFVEPYNLEVTYVFGTPPPVMGKMAARHLAIEFAKLWSGDDDCALPQRVTSVTRQGISFTILDNQDFIAELRTGIYSVDLFLKGTNPDKARNRAKVFSPDVPRARKYTPKPLKYSVSSSKDIVIGRSTPDSATFSIAGTELADIADGWSPLLILRSYDGTRSVTMPESAVEINDVADTVTITVAYNRGLEAVLLVDPGSWDLYAVKDDETVYITSANLQIKLSS